MATKKETTKSAQVGVSAELAETAIEAVENTIVGLSHFSTIFKMLNGMAADGSLDGDGAAGELVALFELLGRGADHLAEHEGETLDGFMVQLRAAVSAKEVSNAA